MTQKGDPYTKVFSTLSEVILMCCILAQLNIFCSSVRKPYFTKMAIHPLFTVHMLRPLHVFNILDLIEALQQKLYRQDFRDVDRLKHVLLHCWVRWIRCNWRVPDQLRKEWRWCLGYITYMLNCCWLTDINSQRWLSILRELYVIFECHA